MNLTSQQIIELAQRTFRVESDALAVMADTIGEEFALAVKSILSATGKLIVTGMGKSGLVGRKIAATLSSTGTPSLFLHPAEACHGDLGMISKDDIVLALSFSGETDEVLNIVPFIRQNGNTMIAMTRNAESTLAKNADIHLLVAIKEEACPLNLAPTTSTTVQIAMGDALAVALMKLREFTAADFARFHPHGSLGRRLLMTVGDVMRKNNLPITTTDCPVIEMVHKVSKGGLCLIILMQDDKIEGLVTDGDIRRAMERLQADFFNIRAVDIATRHPKTILASAKLIEAEEQMIKHNIASLLVVDDEGLLQGVISLGDIRL
ncbi:MAG: KpsF/GutQ family sugar-phosphate isomerase [Alistipes sp.]|nr:KpsF/GutQ family sugar-phosphate isomerase [Alistipes sp.]